jgi:hypothetical protein
MMIKTYTKEVYRFEELDDEAKSRAVSDYVNNGGLDYDWYDFVFDDFKEIGKLLGVEVKEIYFSGFWSQGDGASFEGGYAYSKNSKKAIREYAPLDEELHAIADALQEIEKDVFYQAIASIDRSSYRYCHEMTMTADVESYDDQIWYCGVYGKTAVAERVERDLLEQFRKLARWLYRELEREYTYLTSEEGFADIADANEWEFLKSGAMA